MPTIDIAMKSPHSAVQRTMIESPDNIVALCGRRFGKTDGFVQRLFYRMHKTPGLYWWIGLSWKSASMKRAWREVTAVSRKVLAALGLSERGHINRSKYEIKIPGMGEIWFRTADNPASLAGEGIRGVVLDEFTLMKEIVWTEYVQATLLDFGGWAAFGGVPKGNNWGANLYHAAASLPGWKQLHATSYDNKYIDPSLIDKIKGTATEMLFRQEYMAEIVDDAGSVFRRVIDAATADPQSERVQDEHEQYHDYVIGVDLAKYNDFTVFTVIDLHDNAVVYVDRFNQIDFTVQLQRLKVLNGLFQPVTNIIEINFNEMFAENARLEDLPVTEFRTTNATKSAIIDSLTFAFEQGHIKIINDPILIGELQAYEMKRLPAGTISYNAPAGMHDDTVMSLAIGWSGVRSRAGGLLLW